MSETRIEEQTTGATCPVDHAAREHAANNGTSNGAHRLAPGPSRALALAMLARNRGNLLVFMKWCHDHYGDIFRLPLGHGLTILNDPDVIGPWLVDGEHRYVKGEQLRAVSPALGDGLATSEGERHRRTRKALGPMFGRKGLDAVAPIVAGAVSSTMDRWEEYARTGQEVDLIREFGMMTMTTFQRGMLSSCVADEDVPHLCELMTRQSEYVTGLSVSAWSPLGWTGFVPGARHGKPAAREIDALLDRVVADRRAHPTDTPDMLNQLLAIRHEDTGEGLSDPEVRDELNTLLVGGFDTTAHALSWATALLATNPEAAERLRQEADAYDGSFESTADLDRLPYALAAFREGQRIQGFPPLAYEATVDDELGGYHIPAGTQVAICDYLLGRSAKLWKDPHRYDPERFMGERLQQQHRYQSLPFSGGRRYCMGFRFSFLQSQFALTMMAQRFHIQPRPGFAIRHTVSYPIAIRGGLPATIRLRSGRG